MMCLLLNPIRSQQLFMAGWEIGLNSLIKNMKPRKILSIASLLLLILGFAISGRAFDIQLHDTYYVISFFHAAILICAYFLFCSFIYYLFDRMHRPLNRQWSQIHVWITVISLLSILLALTFISDVNELFIVSTVLIFGLAQLMFLLIIFFRILKKPDA